MKKNKIIGIAIALSGMVVAFGTSLAMYKVAETNLGFGIGKASYSAATGDINYKVGTAWDVTNPNPSPESKTVTAKLPLSAVYPNTVAEQNYIVGKLDITITLPSSLTSGVSAKGEVKGATDYNAYYENIYGTEQNFTSSSNVLSYTREVCVPAGQASPTLVNSMYVELTINFGTSLDNNDTFFALANQGYSVAATWGAPTAFKNAYVVGDGNDWTVQDEFKMVPNLAADSWEWVHEGITGFTEVKFIKEKDGESGYDWLDNGNITGLAAASTYNCYWSGDLNASQRGIDGTTVYAHN